MPEILITGGAGFIGSHLVHTLLANGHSISVIDNFSSGKKSYLTSVQDKIRIVESDILDRNVVENFFSEVKPEIIYHLAAIHHIPTCEKDPQLTLRTNVEGTGIVLEAARKSNSVKKVLFASSGAVYAVADTELNELSSPLFPGDMYSLSKLCGENIMQLYAYRKHFKVISCRLFNTVGPGETNAHLVPEIIDQIIKGSEIIRLGNLHPKRSYVHVADVAKALQRLGEYDSPMEFDVFNIGKEEQYSAEDIVKMLIKISGKEIGYTQIESKMRPFDRLTQPAGMKKLKNALGWQPELSVEKALMDAFQEAIPNE